MPAPHPERPVPTETPLQHYRTCLYVDLYRRQGRSGARAFLAALCGNPGFQITFWFRTAQLASRDPTFKCLYPLVQTVSRRVQSKRGVLLAPPTQVGPGLFLDHVSDIFINSRAVIGNNCNISNGVTIGQTNRGKRKGCPSLGHNVFVGPGAKILSNVTVGNNVAIGANCVVVEDVPDNAVVAAQPGQVISYRGTAGYIEHTDYLLADCLR